MCCFHSVCPVHFALHILEPRQALGWAAAERNTAFSQRTDTQERQGNLRSQGRKGVELEVSGYGQATAPVSGETSVMMNLGKCDTEQAPGQDTKMCLGLEQGRHWADFSGMS